MKVKYIESNEVPEELLRIGYTEQFRIDRAGPAELTVYGIMCWQQVVHYLVIPGRENLPFWMPACLFVVVESLIPMEWYFKNKNELADTGLDWLMGYREMIKDPRHYVGLIERVDQPVRDFLKRKAEIDEYIH